MNGRKKTALRGCPLCVFELLNSTMYFFIANKRYHNFRLVIAMFFRMHTSNAYVCTSSIQSPSAYSFPIFFFSRSICLILFSGVGNASGIVPPSSLIVWRTFAPTSWCVWLA